MKRTRFFLAIFIVAVMLLQGCGVTRNGAGGKAGPTRSKSISILAIGNSFSVDAMQYLYDILKEDGAEEITLGNLYIGGCTLKRHEGNFTGNAPAYKYYKNTTGEWTATEKFKPLDALDERDWDYITLQQASGVSGIPDSYSPHLETLLGIVREHCPNAKLYWHMTWAYQGNSTHKEFPKYNSDQMTMYNAILGAVREKVLTHNEFTGVIPSGTAIQNLRGSIYGDTVTRDGYHLAHDSGRYAAALTWAGTLYGTDPRSITWHPADYSYTDAQLKAIRDAVRKAVKTAPGKR